MNPMIFVDLSDGLEDIMSKLIPNWTSFVVQLAAFLVLVAIVIYFGYKPVKKMITPRITAIIFGLVITLSTSLRSTLCLKR